MARETFDDKVDTLVAFAEGDLDAVHDAIQSVQAGARTAGTAEHIAFTLLAATWRRVADERKRAPNRSPAG
jgi:hypothetical protein